MRIKHGMLQVSVVFFCVTLIAGAYCPSLAQPKAPDNKSIPKKTVTDTEKKIPEVKADTVKKSDDQEKDADYWYNKGILVSVYGNNKAAIQYFQKVIQLDPQRSNAFFQMGVSYGELGEHQKAINFITKAIELNSEKGVYYYGRGRVYLLSGNKEKAFVDFEQAATLGNKDAKNYLEKTSGTYLK